MNILSSIVLFKSIIFICIHKYITCDAGWTLKKEIMQKRTRSKRIFICYVMVVIGIELTSALLIID